MSEGYDKLMEAVKGDCAKYENCFNPEGCDKEHSKCFNNYCSKFKWAIDRAKMYGEALGVNWEDILDSWEKDRSYWYQNYYQEANQPEINSDKTRVFETVDEMLGSLGDGGFRCPYCGAISTNPYECNSGKQVDGKTCDWKVYGLLRDLGKGVFVYCKDRLKGEIIFMPIAWEQEEQP